MSNKIQQLAPEERPYEKCLAQGTGALTDTELLAVILRSGTASYSSLDLAGLILEMSNGSARGLLGLHHHSITELQKLPGIGKVKAIQIKCIAELSVRMAKTYAKEQLSYDSPGSIADYYMEQFRHEEQELLMGIMLDTKNHLLGEELLTKGTVNASLISPRELFLAALKYQAVNMILIHNHPSGDPAPSQEDLAVTRKVSQAGELLDIHLLDHIIIGDRRYVSLRQEKLL
ncbi:MAG: RadC family protein [Blautia sp.]|jgi:DNA repair protein RadC